MADNAVIQTIAKWGLIKLQNTLLEESDVKKILQDKKILLADDESLSLIITTKYLEKYQINVDIVKDGEDALSMVKKNNYDIILMDISMPELDGVLAVQKIRQFQQENNLPSNSIIAFTGDDSRQKIHQILSAGFNDYFIKGRDYKWLLQLLALESARVDSR
jgi:CheY-like chemotaxis protein